jgi:uncharacterized membrane protein YhaH (DUF805 family)
MNMSEAVRSVLSKYATFSGRAGRPEFWWWVLASLLASIVVNLLDYAIGMGDVRPLSAIYGLAILLPQLAVSVRRLHDADRTGWWLLLALVPIIGWLVLIWFYIQRGTEGTNRFG